jgi:hypothetical protein
MQTTIAAHATIRRHGRPLVYSVAEFAALVLVAAALVATAALPALSRHPHYAEAKSVTASQAHRR